MNHLEEHANLAQYKHYTLDPVIISYPTGSNNTFIAIKFFNAAFDFIDNSFEQIELIELIKQISTETLAVI